MTKYDYKENSANKGMNFEFCETISYEVLNNYLSRAVTLAHESGEEVSCSDIDNIRFILNIGAKFIGRLTVPWVVTKSELETHKQQKEFIELLHSYDPEIICEACVFENITPSINEIAIPNWVFEAFNLPVEERNFSCEKMLFENGLYRNHFGEGSVPDVCRIETQMYFYWRSCLFIDMGFEALHMGQIYLIGEQDTNFKSYTRLFRMIREYARKKARRKMVLINAHAKDIYDSDGNLLLDFNEWPIGGEPPKDAVEHRPDEYPQELYLNISKWDWPIYGKSKGGMTPSGWYTKSLPYLVELDNAGGIFEGENKPQYISWGMDDISWFANQNDEYRRNWLKYAYPRVEELDECGHFQLPGRRIVTCKYFGRKTDRYYAPDFGDEETIKEVFLNSALKK